MSPTLPLVITKFSTNCHAALDETAIFQPSALARATKPIKNCSIHLRALSTTLDAHNCNNCHIRNNAPPPPLASSSDLSNSRARMRSAINVIQRDDRARPNCNRTAVNQRACHGENILSSLIYIICIYIQFHRTPARACLYRCWR